MRLLGGDSLKNISHIPYVIISYRNKITNITALAIEDDLSQSLSLLVCTTVFIYMHILNPVKLLFGG